MGSTFEDVASDLGLSADTLARRRKDSPAVVRAFERGDAELKIALREKQIAVAMNDGHASQGTLLVWCGKISLGQSEKLILQTASAEGALDTLRLLFPDVYAPPVVH